MPAGTSSTDDGLPESLTGLGRLPESEVADVFLLVLFERALDFVADGEAALQESPFFELPAEETGFSGFVNSLVAEGGGDAPESGLEAVALAMTSPWTTRGDRRRQIERRGRPQSADADAQA